MNPIKKLKGAILLLAVCFLIFNELNAQAIQDSDINSDSNSNSRFPKETDSGSLGVGITLFGPTGFTAKYLVDDDLSVEGSVGVTSFGKGKFHAHSVILYNFLDLSEELNLYVGGGVVFNQRKNDDRGFLSLGDYSYDSSLGLRFPVGIAWRMEDRRFEITTEIYANLFMTGVTGTDIGAAIAGRYYF